MDVLSFAAQFSDNLTQLYTETKKSALNNVVKEETTPALSTLHRKFRIQKDRLITWGLEWSDQATGPEGNIDESVARAGLTETVTSVLENIKEVLEQAEKIRSACRSTHSQPWPIPTGFEKVSRDVVDESKYQDLVNDLSTSVDILYDLSRSRRALATGSHPKFSTDVEAVKAPPPVPPKTLFRSPSFASSEITLVNPPKFYRPNLSPYAGLPPNIDPSALILPEEQPPPYETPGTPPSSTRMIGRILRRRVSDSVSNVLSSPSEEAIVLVEFANFDSVYRDSGIPPPLNRLESLYNFIQQSKSQPNLSLLGYFEDPDQPRIGLVYDFLGSMHEKVTKLGIESEQLAPVSLLRLLQAASKSAKTTGNLTDTPSLETRFQVAIRVTERLKEMHVNFFPHGNVTSASVTFITKAEQARRLPHDELRYLSLCSFDLFSESSIGGASIPNYYKHPDDQSKIFSIIEDSKYDLYGLGLMLLEIGLWAPLSDIYKSKYSSADFKLRLEKIWIPRLAAKCGSVYMRVVQTCLRFSDESDSNLPLDRTYENILNRLSRCCLLDEDEPIQLESAESRESRQGKDSGHLMSSNASSVPLRKPRRNVSPHQGYFQTQPTSSHSRSPSLSLSPPANAPYSLASLPNIASSLPMAVAGLSPGKEDVPVGGTPAGHTSRLRSLSSSSDLVKEGLSSAVNSLQQSWRTHRDSSTWSFKEYRAKVVLIQSHWRERRKLKSDAASDVTASSSLESSRARSTQGGTIAEPWNPLTSRTNDSADCQAQRKLKPCIFPVCLPQTMIDAWHSDIGLRLSRIVERALKNSPESSSIDLVGLGLDKLNARPTILVTCTNTARVKAAIKRKFDYDRSTFDLKIRKGRVSLSRGQSRRGDVCRRSSGRGSEESESDFVAAQNPYYQKRPICGASIGAYLPDEGHLLPVTFGGVVLVDDKPYGMSVHHMLEPPSDDEDDGESEKNAELGASENDEYDQSDSASEGVATRTSARLPVTAPITSRRRSSRSPVPSAQSDDEASIRDLWDDSQDEDEDAGYFSSEFESDVSDSESLSEGPTSHSTGSFAEPGDTMGFPADMTRTDITITQPALTDAVDQDLHADDIPQEDQDDDHLQSYKLGTLYASSGLRRFRASGTTHEIDWALVALDPPRLQPYNLIQGGRRYCTSTPPTFCPALESPIARHPGGTYTPEEDLYPTAILPSSSLANLAVHCFGRTSGLKTGTIGAGMSFVKIYGRKTFSVSWSVVGEFGVGGDSGAWVVGNESGGVAGHVLAERGGLTYICPMEVLVEDIRRTLGAVWVRLPGAFGREVDLQAKDVKEKMEMELVYEGGHGKVQDARDRERLVGVVDLLSLGDGATAAGKSGSAANGKAVHSRLGNVPCKRGVLSH